MNRYLPHATNKERHQESRKSKEAAVWGSPAPPADVSVRHQHHEEHHQQGRAFSHRLWNVPLLPRCFSGQAATMSTAMASMLLAIFVLVLVILSSLILWMGSWFPDHPSSFDVDHGNKEGRINIDNVMKTFFAPRSMSTLLPVTAVEKRTTLFSKGGMIKPNTFLTT